MEFSWFYDKHWHAVDTCMVLSHLLQRAKCGMFLLLEAPNMYPASFEVKVL